MKHHNIVKKTAHLLILASVLLVVANVSIWAASMSFLSGTSAKAACSANTQPATFSVYSPSDQVANVTFSRTTLDPFRYKVEVIDNNTFQGPTVLYSETFDAPAGMANPDPVPTSRLTNSGSSISSTAIVKVTFTTSLSDATPCVHTPVENTVTFSNTGGSGTVVTPDNEADLTPTSIPIAELFGVFNFPKHFDNLTQVFEVIVKFLFWILGILAFISLVMGGIQFVTSGGDPTKAAKAKKTLLFSVLGILLAIFSVVIFNVAASFWGGPK